MSKKIILLILFILPFIVRATTYTSTINGNWSSTATWGGTISIPGSGDTVTIATTVTLDANESIKNITINNSKALTVSGSNTLTVYGSFTNNGTFTYSTGTVTFAGSVNQTIGGSSATTFYNLTTNPSSSTDTIFLNKAINVNNNFTISQGVLACKTFSITGNASGIFSMASGTTLVIGIPTSTTFPGFPTTFGNSQISLDPASTVVYQSGGGQTVSSVPYYGNVRVTTQNASTTTGGTLFYVKGSLTVTGVTFSVKSTVDTIKGNVTISSGGTYSTSSANEYLQGNFTNNGTVARTSGTVYFIGTAGQTIGGSGTTTFDNLTINSGATVTLGNALTVSGAFLLSAGTFDVSVSNYSLTVRLNFTNNSTFNEESGTVTLNCTSAQTLGGTTSTTFYNLTINAASTGTVTMSNAITITNNLTISGGTLSTSTYQITGSSTGGNLSMAAGTSLLLGSNVSTTVVDFPTNYVAANISLNVTSTVDYLTHSGSQPISVVPTYGDLIIAGLSSSAKSLTGSPLQVAGNLTVNPSAVLGVAANTINLTGNMWINQGTLTFTTGTLNVEGNFTNTSGAYTTGTSTTVFNGSSNQVISSTASGLIFYNLTVNPASSTDTVFSEQNTTISNNLTISTGVLNQQTSVFNGNSSGAFTMAANTELVLGLPSSTAAVPFPSSFSTAHITFNSGSTVVYQAKATQTVSAAPAYVNLVVSTGSTATTKTLAGNITINGNLAINTNTTLDCQTYQITGNASSNMTMASGSNLLLGVSGSGTNVLFPTGYGSGTGTISLNSNSTVVYQSANSSQNISSYPTYGTLVISSTSSVTKAPTGTSLTIAGNLTVKGSATLSMTSNTINLTGIDTIGTGATESFTSGALNIGGNFVCNGTFTYGTSTTTFNGSLGQAIGGSSYPTFYNLTISGGSSETVTLGNNQTVTDSLKITGGNLDVTSSNYSVTVGGNFPISGGTFIPHSGTVTMNGTTQNLGGSVTLSLYKLVISSGTTTLKGNVTLASDLTIGGSLNASSRTLTIAGNFIDNGTFTPSSSTISFNSSGHQCIEGSVSSVSFQNMTVGAMSILGVLNPHTINIGGLITIMPGGLMNCSCP